MIIKLNKEQAGKLGLKEGQEIEIKESKPINEQEVDIKKIVKDLKGDFGGSNEDQLRGVQLLKGLAISDDPLANDYMKKLNTATTQISNEILGE